MSALFERIPFVCPSITVSIVIILAATPLATCGDNSEINVSPGYTSFIARATIQIIRTEYVPRSSSLTVIRAAAVSPETRYHQSGFINEVLNNTWADISVTIERYDHVSEQRTRFFNVFFVDGYAAFRLIYGRMDERSFDFTGIYTIVLTESSRYQYETITAILEDLWVMNIVNVVVLVSIHPRARTAVYTYFPFTQFHCEAVVPVILNYYLTSGFLYADSEFFPVKMAKLFGCPLLLAAYHLVPFMLLTQRTDGSYFLDGIEGITMRVLAQRMNFTPIVMVPPHGVGRGALYKNGTATGALRMVLEHEVNLTIGAIAFTGDRFAVMSPTFPYFQSATCMAVPKGRHYTAFEKLFLPFNTIIWVGTVALFVGAAVMFALLRLAGEARLQFVVGQHNRTPFVNMAAVFLGNALTDAMPVRNFARYVLMVWMLACIVLRNAYQGALFHHLQVPKFAAPIDRMDDLIAANYSLRVHPTLFYLFDGIPKAKPYLRPSRYATNMEDFDELTNRPTFRDAYLTTELTASYYNMRHKRRTVMISRERLFVVPFSIYLRKHSCLTPPINEQLNRYMVSGLLKNWLSNYYDESVMRITVDPGMQTDFQPLHLSQVAGAFQICGYMLVVSVTVLGLELLALRCRQLRLVFDGM